MESKMKVLVVDDEEYVRELCLDFLSEKGFEVYTLDRGDSAMSFIERTPVDIIILDIMLPGISGLELLGEIKSTYPDLDVLMITGYSSIESAVQMIKLGAYDYLPKPLDLVKLGNILGHIRDKKALEDKAQRLEWQSEGGDFHGIVGRSRPMLEVFSIIKSLARHSINVLVMGETGTGKELVANVIHELSPRRDKPFVPCNCSALVDTLLESELFGHVKGAFTGAMRTKRGLFSIADGGTIFLDEIGELPTTTQVKLLRVIEGGEVQPIGSEEIIKVDVRVLAATNRDLRSAVDEDRFRRDLYHRLNVSSIYLPPLRERKEDIPLLCEHFLRSLDQRLGKNVVGLSPRVMSILENYHWPGNVRELRNALERATAVADGKYIELNNLPPNLREDTEVVTTPVTSVKHEGGMSLENMEMEHIRSVLIRTSGNKAKAAQILGISRRSLYRKIEKYQIDI